MLLEVQIDDVPKDPWAKMSRFNLLPWILGRQNHSLKPKEVHVGVRVVPAALCPAHAPAPASSLAAAALK